MGGDTQEKDVRVKEALSNTIVGSTKEKCDSEEKGNSNGPVHDAISAHIKKWYVEKDKI